MKNLLFYLLLFFASFAVQAQIYWQQKLSYTIDVTLHPDQQTLDGFEKLVYHNQSPDTLTYIWFHLWPNAYKNDRTAFSDQLLQNGNTQFYFSTREQRGYINQLQFKVNGMTARTEDHPQHIDIVKLLLPQPLAPDGSLTITTPFHVKLPYNFSRGGFSNGTYQVTQWYPKPAVYDARGWHPMPYLDQGEFYSEFGEYNVQITLPKNYVVAATGQLQEATEKEWLKSRAEYRLPVANTLKLSKTNKPYQFKSPVLAPPTYTKTISFRQESAHDFAFFADKDFIVKEDTCLLPSGKVISVLAYYTPTYQKLWQNSLLYAKRALRFYSVQLGDYPYDVATVVQGPQSFGGGMEYPSITVLAPVESEVALDGLIAHELGHNWFYGALATNERDHPWMDEGMNSFYENKYLQEYYGRQPVASEISFQTKAFNKTDQPITTSSVDFNAANYGLVAYHKTAEWMKALEAQLGSETFGQLMREYYATWKFKHPQPEDFTFLVKKYGGQSVESLLALLNTKGSLPQNVKKGTTVFTPFTIGLHPIKRYSLTKNNLFLSPALGANLYDKTMIGAVATNYGLPPTRFGFLAVPFFATGTQAFTGLGKLVYRIRSGGAIKSTDLFFNAATFHMDEVRDANDKKFKMRFTKLVPGVRFQLKEKDPRSTRTRSIQWKTYFIGEDVLRITADSIFSPIDTTIRFLFSTPRQNRTLNQLQIKIGNHRALYPFHFQLQAEQTIDFIRTAVTAGYFFNYAKGGGLDVRFFGGKFSYLGGTTINKRFENDRYHLNMTGARGFEDYTYSDYFLGRNKFEGYASQQIMVRDGAFKVRTDLLADKVGKSDNWLMAANFTTTIPNKINPLSVLPVKIPVRFFLDLGTYAEAWQENADTDRLLFDAGVMLPLFNESVNIYIPLFYSKVYSNYFKSTLGENRFIKTISFSINFFNKDLKSLNREAEY